MYVQNLHMYSSAQCRYLTFCELYRIPPLPLSETSVCLFAAFLVHQGLRSQSIPTYLSALRHLQISAGLQPLQQVDWPRLQYMLKGIARSQTAHAQTRLPVTHGIMRKLQEACISGQLSDYQSRMLWAACCLAILASLDLGNSDLSTAPSICASDLEVDSHQNPSIVRVHLHSAKTDPFGTGVSIYIGRTGTPLCQCRHF